MGRRIIFHKDEDYAAFERVIEDVHRRLPVRLLGYCLMPNHWHLVLWPKRDEHLSEFMRLLTVTHTQRWHADYHSAGSGPVYQGRFKSFPVQEDDHLLAVCQYVERNALRAKLVERAERWRWCSIGRRGKDRLPWLLGAEDWPVQLPGGWLKMVNAIAAEAEETAVRECLARGRPWGEEAWVRKTARVLSLGSTLRPRGRPKKRKPAWKRLPAQSRSA